MTLNIKKTHSERLMPLIDSLLSESDKAIDDVTCIAVAAGPGSFTGLRIGVSTARGLAQALNIPVVPVCTLKAMAEGVYQPGILICPILDARRSQVYTALFRRSKNNPSMIEALIEPVALSIEELVNTLGNFKEPVMFLGEGLDNYAEKLSESFPAGRALLSPAPLRLCRASLVAMQGITLLKEKPESSYLDLLPSYLRRPEAERLLDESGNTS